MSTPEQEKDFQRLSYHARKFALHPNALMRVSAAVDRWSCSSRPEDAQELYRHAVHVSAWVGLATPTEDVLLGAVRLLRRLLDFLDQTSVFPRLALGLSYAEKRCDKHPGEDPVWEQLRMALREFGSHPENLTRQLNAELLAFQNSSHRELDVETLLQEVKLAETSGDLLRGPRLGPLLLRAAAWLAKPRFLQGAVKAASRDKHLDAKIQSKIREALRICLQMLPDSESHVAKRWDVQMALNRVSELLEGVPLSKLRSQEEWLAIARLIGREAEVADRSEEAALEHARKPGKALRGASRAAASVVSTAESLAHQAGGSLRGTRVCVGGRCAWIVGPGPQKDGKKTACAVFDDWEVENLALDPSGKLEAAREALDARCSSVKGAWSEEDVEKLKEWAARVPEENSAAIWDWMACEFGRLQALGETSSIVFKWWALQRGACHGKGNKQHESGITAAMLVQVLEQIPGQAGSWREIRDHIRMKGLDAGLCSETAPGTKGVAVWEKQGAHLLATKSCFAKDKQPGKRIVYRLAEDAELPQSKKRRQSNKP